MRKSLILVLISCLSFVTVSAQDKQVRKNLFPKVRREVKAVVDTAKPKTPVEFTDIAKKDTIITDSVLVKPACLAPDTTELVSLRVRVSQLESELKASSNKMVKMQQEMDQKLRYADTVIVKLSYRRLSEPFNKDNVDRAIADMSKLYSKEMIVAEKADIELLKGYENYYFEIRSIVSDAQDDMRRTSLFSDPKEFITDYKAKVTSSPYYRKYYSNKATTSKYLNGMIDSFLGILSNHSAEKRADFSDLL